MAKVHIDEVCWVEYDPKDECSCVRAIKAVAGMTGYRKVDLLKVIKKITADGLKPRRGSW